MTLTRPHLLLPPPLLLLLLLLRVLLFVCVLGSNERRPYDIVATSHDAGIIEAIPDTVSIDALKKVCSAVILGSG